MVDHRDIHCAPDLPQRLPHEPRRAALVPCVVGIAFAAACIVTLPSAIGAVQFAASSMDVGIAMILAVSLNIVNGMTGPVFDRPRGLHGTGRLHGRHHHVLRLAIICGAARRSTADSSASENGCLSLACVAAGWSPPRLAMSSACRRCACVAITWRSSRSASARSCAWSCSRRIRG